MSAPPKRILIVEDQRLIAADIEHTLRKVGYAIAGSVASGEEAVQLARSVSPDLILMDIRLRGPMDGIAAAGAIRDAMDVPILYLTANADEETILRAKGTSPSGYVVKPFNERELRAAIEIALAKHESDLLLAEERARRRAAEEFKLLVQGVREYAIFMLDPAGRVATWNDGARRIKGYTADEIIGKDFAIFYPPEERAAGLPAVVLDRALRDGRAELEGWRVRKDGSRFWADVVITAIRDDAGRLHGFGKVTRDLTERKQAAERLLHEQKLLRAAFMDAPACVCVLRGADHTFELANRAYRALLGGRDVEGHPVRAAIPELEEQGYVALLDRVYRTREPFFGTEMLSSLRQPDGSTTARYFNFVYQPIGSLADGTDGIIAFGFDVTEQVLARQRVEQLAAEREALVAELQRAVEARDEFLQIASHELKTPLTPLQLQLESVARLLRKSGAENDRLSASLATAMRQTQRLTRLVESLLDVSQITAGGLVLDLEPFDLAALVGDVAARFAAEARKHGSELVVRAMQPIPGVWDRMRVDQIVSNLLSNAIKYGAGKPIDVDAQATAGGARIAVRDRGIGIDGEALARIFGRFERAVSSRHFGGLGLGLFIARRYAEAHGGEIQVESEPGDGALFTVILPARERA